MIYGTTAAVMTMNVYAQTQTQSLPTCKDPTGNNFQCMMVISTLPAPTSAVQCQEPTGQILSCSYATQTLSNGQQIVVITVYVPANFVFSGPVSVVKVVVHNTVTGTSTSHVVPFFEHTPQYLQGFGYGINDGRVGVYDPAPACAGLGGKDWDHCLIGYKYAYVKMCTRSSFGCGDGPTTIASSAVTKSNCVPLNPCVTPNLGEPQHTAAYLQALNSGLPNPYKPGSKDYEHYQAGIAARQQNSGTVARIVTPSGTNGNINNNPPSSTTKKCPDGTTIPVKDKCPTSKQTNQPIPSGSSNPSSPSGRLSPPSGGSSSGGEPSSGSGGSGGSSSGSSESSGSSDSSSSSGGGSGGSGSSSSSSGSGSGSGP